MAEGAEKSNEVQFYQIYNKQGTAQWTYAAFYFQLLQIVSTYALDADTEYISMCTVSCRIT